MQLSQYYDYLEEKWLSIPFEFRIVILVSILMVLLMLVLYLYFFNVSIFGKLFCCCCRLFKSPTKKRPHTMVRENQAADGDDVSWVENPENDRYCDKFNPNGQFEGQQPLKAKRAHSRTHSFKAIPRLSASVSEIKSELDGNGSFVNEDFNQQVKQKDDNLMENIMKFKDKLNTNIKLINQQSSAGRIPVARRSSLASDKDADHAKPAGSFAPRSDYRSEYLIKVVADNEPMVKETKMPKKIELSPVKLGTNDSVYSGFSQHLQEPRAEEPEFKKTVDEEKKHSAFSSFN